MRYFKVTFVPVEYGEKALTVIVPFSSEIEMKKFYKSDSNQIIDYANTTENEYNEWSTSEAKKKKYQKLAKQL
ncbi:hypothetical protein SAMN05421786_11515 [Chryseobacterium ureilyticum]|uniref:Uncharacterized protein n=1 Tax=Chryseobacterium ureilyticum TaxID=373668 RepID=A0A1N7QRJ0_9FLAO|nr:hypothetical protein [Chryseobacterium ureilyticum]SIT25493.1 hypothetical protein SAMN05421786_11515 [Chryseobacterium ureilyticum]